jgi:phosphopantothenoylcysteine synthetase/decarboxylase
MPIIEKDPTIARLEQDLFAKIQEISPPEPIQKPIGVQQLSVEDAIKELLELEKAMMQPK